MLEVDRFRHFFITPQERSAMEISKENLELIGKFGFQFTNNVLAQLRAEYGEYFGSLMGAQHLTNQCMLGTTVLVFSLCCNFIEPESAPSPKAEKDARELGRKLLLAAAESITTMGFEMICEDKTAKITENF